MPHKMMNSQIACAVDIVVVGHLQVRPMSINRLERQLHPVNQAHIAADGIDIVESLSAVWGTPRAIAVVGALARCTPRAGTMADHPVQQLGGGRDTAAARADTEIEFLQ